ncbi:MAG: NUDIX domain-containing protein [candidate division Zixibacteria bacterium]
MARQPIQVAVYCVRPKGEGWEYLLLHRVTPRWRFWQGISGGVEEEDNDYFAAALRELKEETGFDPIDMELIDYSYTFPVPETMRDMYEQPVDHLTEIVFLARIENGPEPIIDPVEHDKYQWCDYEMAFEMLYWAGNRESLKRCEERLRGAM